jgi:hypothetical protein
MIDETVRINSAEFWERKLPNLPKMYYPLLEKLSDKNVSDSEVEDYIACCQKQVDEYYSYLLAEMNARQDADTFNGKFYDDTVSNAATTIDKLPNCHD